MASRTPTPNTAFQNANAVISRNRLAFEEAKRAMRNDLPAHFVSALDRMRDFISREDAYYPEALPEYVDLLEVNLQMILLCEPRGVLMRLTIGCVDRH